MLDEEERDDTGLKSNFKDKWKRTPSSELNKTFRQDASKFQGILTQAAEADKTVKEKYESCKRAIEILQKSDAELAGVIPKGGSAATRSGSQVCVYCVYCLCTVCTVCTVFHAYNI